MTELGAHGASMADAKAHTVSMAEPAARFLKSKGLSDIAISKMMHRCVRLQSPSAHDKLPSNWAFLEHHIHIPARKLPSVVSRCPQLLVLGLHEKLRPMVDCLSGLGAPKVELADAIARFPNLLVHSVEEKLCPLLAFLQGVGVPENRLAKVLLACPRLISYSVEAKLEATVRFLHGIGVKRGEEMGKLLTQWPHIFGYNVDRRLRPTVEYLKKVGLPDEEIARIATKFPHILCRDAKRAFEANLEFLRSLGFDSKQTAALVCGYPPILISSIKNSLQPKIDFLLQGMGRKSEELVAYPAFFGHSLSRKIQPRYKKLQQKGIQCSLENMLSCNQTKFLAGNLSFGRPIGKLAQLTLNGV